MQEEIFIQVHNMTKSRKSLKKPSSASLVYDHAPLMQLFLKMKNPHAKKELLHVSPKTIQAFSHLARNACRGGIPLPSKKSKSVLLNKDMQALSSPSISIKKKKALLLKKPQKGGGSFLSLLSKIIPTAIGIIGGILGLRKV